MNGENILNKDIFQIDAQKWCKEIETFIQEKTSKSYRDGYVVTISGGLDPSVTAALCVRAIGKDKVTELMLPTNMMKKKTLLLLDLHIKRRIC